MGHLPAASGRGGGGAKTAENYQAQVDRKERELAAGLCTETDLLQAQKNLLSAQTALQSTTDQANKALRQLAILLGKSGTSITLGKFQPYRQRNWLL